MNTAYDLQNLRWVIAEWKHLGVSIAFVPTMGNLHAGHLSLLKEAKRLADRTVVSIFVNPIQFGKGEDYEGYPSTLEADSRKLQAGGLDLLFAPDLKQLYPAGTDVDTRVTVPQLSNILCGKFRPEHFTGVATVVSKLFINVQPDIALFGEKDYQQLLVIKKMTMDLCMPIEIIGVPIHREADGLAMSSRNGYLNKQEREIAPFIYRTLQRAAEQLQQTPTDMTKIEVQGIQTLEAKGFRPEYFSVRRTADLGEPGPGDTQLSILAAAWLGAARLIDNIQVKLAS
ncbi:MAG: pantoate--beta-alanine ligase [Gammaproteobacteria bacterium RIFCSPLOWO2_02_FULL_52_10]|nr:MAG: pantoate--beta-alanine ligase [Gammaproteobacteria bacterium RIFCSPLOWO2_02_FULL_52_10]